jgi:hypothetical protein
MKMIATEDERERDEALELDAQTAGEMARCLVESKRRRGPPLPCPRKLFLWRCSAGVMVETDQASWIAKGEAAELIPAMIRPELNVAAVAGSC